jgi:enoyl-CoA hydratase/carnithine racemase
MRLGCVGETIDATEAVRIGLCAELASDGVAAVARVEALAAALLRRSPTAIAAFKRGCLDALGRPEDERLRIESAAYERCVDAGEAAIGRSAFDAIRRGEAPNWGPRRP